MLLAVRYVVGQALLIGIGVYEDNLLAPPRSLDTEVGRKSGLTGPTFHTSNQKLHDLSSPSLRAALSEKAMPPYTDYPYDPAT
jgi:hypothetical protein